MLCPGMTLLCGCSKKADVKRIMAIMSMGVKQGAEVTVTCEGADEDAAAEAMEKFFKENL